MSEKETLPNWDLSDLYAGIDDPAIKHDLALAATETQRFELYYKGKLASLSGKELGEAIAKYEKISETLGKVMSFAHLNRATQLNNSKAVAFYQGVYEKSCDISNKTIFFDLELNQIAGEALAEKMQAPEMQKYKAYVEIVRAYKKYDLPEDAEKLLQDKSLTGVSAWHRLYEETISAFRFEMNGNSYTEAEMAKFFQDPDAKVRKAAGAALGKVFKEKAPLLSLIVNTLIKDKQLDDELRGYAKPYSSRNLGNQVEDEVVDALVAAVKANYPKLSHRYYALKAKWLGVDKLEYWDRNVPLPTSGEITSYSWAEAKEIVLKAYADFSPEAAAIAKKFFDNNWIDAAPKAGKNSGAFASSSVPSNHPYILMNFQGRPRDVMTLAHELGHGIHQYLARKQGYFQAGTPLTLAETASVFGEMLTFQSLLGAESNPEKRFAMLASKTEDMLNTACRQISFHEYETKLHNERRELGEVTPDRISEIWTEAHQECLGDAVVLDENARAIWGQIPHCIRTPFYVYAYAFGDCLVNSLYTTYKSGKVQNFAGKYLEMLAKGGTEKHKTMLAPFGLDAAKPDFWEQGLKVISGFIDELEQLK